MTANSLTVRPNKLPDLNAKEATQLNLEIQSLTSAITMYFFTLGSKIRKMRDERGYISLGYKSFKEWREGELRFGRATAFRYLQLDKCWRLRLSRIPELEKGIITRSPYVNILAISHIILDKKENGTWKYTDDEVVEWMHACHVLSTSDLYIELEENHPVPRPLIIHWHGKMYKMAELNQGKIVTISQFMFQYNASVQNYWQIFGNRKVRGTLQLDDEEE